MYRVLVEKVVYVSCIKKKRKLEKKFKYWFKFYESKPILTKFSRFSAFIRFLLFEKRNPHKLNIHEIIFSTSLYLKLLENFFKLLNVSLK